MFGQRLLQQQVAYLRLFKDPIYNDIAERDQMGGHRPMTYMHIIHLSLRPHHSLQSHGASGEKGTGLIPDAPVWDDCCFAVKG